MHNALRQSVIGGLKAITPIFRAPRLRLWSGLILFAFLFSHLLNHTLGLWSVRAMEAFSGVRGVIWQNPIGTTLLYSALLVHMGLALWKTAKRRTWRMPLTEALQLGLGLAIPLLLIDHIAGTRGWETVFDIDDTYQNVLGGLWPGLALWQTCLLWVAWIHSMIGLNYWLSDNLIYQRYRPLALSFAVLMPVVSSLGWIEAARRQALAGEGPAPLPPEAVTWLVSVASNGRLILAVLIASAIVVGLLGAAGVFSRGRASVTYPGGRVVRARPGQTLLEISRENGIPHASVCGGRARCSTCRTRILSHKGSLPAPEAAERTLLTRIEAPPDVRLACQLRPKSDLTVQPLVLARPSAGTLTSHDRYRWGVEQPVAVLFVDLRGFTSLSERRLPYDIVFILNEFLGTMSAMVRRNGGIVDKFIGDSVMALFGVAEAPEQAARQSLNTAADMIVSLADLNGRLHEQVSETLRIGIGIHIGPAILGRIGTDGGLTALGDTVNIASRLESATKELSETLVVSSETIKKASAHAAHWQAATIPVRGRAQHLDVYATSDAAAIRAALLAPQS
ncbi:MAG: adenylate/guanylate cyclase domain-containing protein [Pseudomonadota bacterium]